MLVEKNRRRVMTLADENHHRQVCLVCAAPTCNKPLEKEGGGGGELLNFANIGIFYILRNPYVGVQVRS